MNYRKTFTKKTQKQAAAAINKTQANISHLENSIENKGILSPTIADYLDYLGLEALVIQKRQ